MAKRRLFTVETPLGYRVFLERDRWRQIIRHKHPALTGKERRVRDCLESPQLIRESAKESDVHLYYTSVADEEYLCVVAAISGDEERFVVTAYFTSNIKKGTALWTS